MHCVDTHLSMKGQLEFKHIYASICVINAIFLNSHSQADQWWVQLCPFKWTGWKLLSSSVRQQGACRGSTGLREFCAVQHDDGFVANGKESF